VAYERDGYEKTEYMGEEKVRMMCGLTVEQGIWRIRTNQELWEI
jgi:hypothetical protein